MLTYLKQIPFVNYIIISFFVWILIIALCGAAKRRIKGKILLFIEILYITSMVCILFAKGTEAYRYINTAPLSYIRQCIADGNMLPLLLGIVITIPIPVFMALNKIRLLPVIFASFIIALLIEPVQLIENIITGSWGNAVNIDQTILYLMGICIGLAAVFLFTLATGIKNQKRSV